MVKTSIALIVTGAACIMLGVMGDRFELACHLAGGMCAGTWLGAWTCSKDLGLK